jgi:hypothetical protein
VKCLSVSFDTSMLMACQCSDIIEFVRGGRSQILSETGNEVSAPCGEPEKLVLN